MGNNTGHAQLLPLHSSVGDLCIISKSVHEQDTPQSPISQHNMWALDDNTVQQVNVLFL